jgi:putative Mg2+ transporter-C (MgtC) family protein
MPFQIQIPYSLPIQLEDLIKLAAAIIIGGLLGAEREFHDKAAGLRTLILICLGSTLFTIFSIDIAGFRDPGRIAAQIVTGIGFLGAGVIIQQRGRVRGLTTASTIWLTAALGIGIGVGDVAFTFIATFVALFVLWVLPRFERRLECARTFREYHILTVIDAQLLTRLEKMFLDARLSIKERRQMKRGDQMLSVWQVAGPPDGHERVIAALMEDPAIHELEY